VDTPGAFDGTAKTESAAEVKPGPELQKKPDAQSKKSDADMKKTFLQVVF